MTEKPDGSPSSGRSLMRFSSFRMNPALVRNASVMYGSVIASGAVQYLTLIIMARELGPSGLGIVVLATTVGSMLTAAVEFGIGPVLIRFRPQYEKHEPELWSAIVRSMTRIVVFAAIGVLCLAGAAMLLSSTVSSVEGLTRTVAFGASIAAPMILFIFFQTYLQSARQFTGIAALSIATASLRLGLTVGLLQVGNLTAYSAIATYVAVAWLGAAAGWVVTLHRAQLSRVNERARKRARELVLPYLRWTMVGRAVIALNGRVDILLLSVLAGAGSTGIYGAAAQTAAPVSMLATAVGEVSFPHFVRHDRKGGNASRILRWAVWLPPLVVGGIIVAIGGAYILPALLGPGFQESAGIFAVLVVAYAIQVWLQPIAMLLYASDRHQAAVWIAIAQTSALVLLDLILIPVLGGLGAAVAVLITIVASGPAMIIAAVRARQMANMPVT